MPKQSILLLSFSPLNRDPRVQRQITFLRDHFQITCAGFSNSGIEGVSYIAIPLRLAGLPKKALQACRLKAGRYESYYWNVSYIKDARRCLNGSVWNLILANDLLSLPLAIELARPNGAKVIVDAHEYEPLHFDDDWYFNFFYRKFWDYVARQYLPQADAMTTVCDSIAAAYHKNYNVECVVINNACEYYDLRPSSTDPARIRMIHHGISNPSRRLENMIELMAHLDRRYTLDMMLVPDNQRYYRKITNLAKGKSNIKMRDPVPLKDIVPTLNQYDLGLFLLSPKAFNYRMALPNKLFEFIQARLGVAVWPSPEMAKIVNEYGVGVVTDEFSVASAAASLNHLSTADIQRFKAKSHAAAHRLSAEQNRADLLNMVQRLINS